MKLKDVKVGDELTRILGGSVPLQVIVGYVDEQIIKVGSKDGAIGWEDGWTFNRETAREIDEDLGWDGVLRSGSRIIV